MSSLKRYLIFKTLPQQGRESILSLNPCSAKSENTQAKYKKNEIPLQIGRYIVVNTRLRG